MTQRLTLLFSETNKSFDAIVGQDIIAGIATTCDINLECYFQGRIKTISRQHFKLTFYPGEGYTITDLNSRNGTAVNGQALQPEVPRYLRHGDLITLARNEAFGIGVLIENAYATEAVSNLQPRRVINQTQTGIIYEPHIGQFIVDGKTIPLTYFTNLEHQLLKYLCMYGDRICTYDALAEHVWEGWVQNNTIAKTISNLRQKLNDISANAGDRIMTIRGRGFMCVIQDITDPS